MGNGQLDVRGLSLSEKEVSLDKKVALGEADAVQAERK